MVVVPKSNDQVRICVDLTRLNDSVKRERHILPSVDETLAQLGGAKVFSKLDANSGFHQIPLSKESTLLTTFITPFGRFCYNRLPFGITSAPEHFQKRMTSVLAGVEETANMIDDTLVYGRDQQEHDERLERVLKKLESAGVPLNIGSKDLDTLPPSVQRFRMRLMRFHYSIQHIPCKDLIMADMLSRAPVENCDGQEENLHEVSQEFVDHVVATANRQLDNIAALQREDEVCQLLMKYCRDGWPEKANLIKLYQSVAGELTVQIGLLMRECRIVIPSLIRMDILEKLHTGHLGIVRCRQRANRFGGQG
ncbi:uncharacterized protein K02A2.6-like [Nematostella vectensis]|uniref:uncharacterized protein K02A2.6-like n=1 Tax=Nematostella vectensis TaxID=45351 RepID=UPI0020770CF4|nr:uncharacterized protein K02A2.6-like [Nematostella vectensis]